MAYPPRRHGLIWSVATQRIWFPIQAICRISRLQIIHFRMSTLCSMIQHSFDKAGDPVAIKHEQPDTEGKQPQRHAESEDDAEHSDVENLEIHFIGIDTSPQKKTDLDGK